MVKFYFDFCSYVVIIVFREGMVIKGLMLFLKDSCYFLGLGDGFMFWDIFL